MRASGTLTGFKPLFGSQGIRFDFEECVLNRVGSKLLSVWRVFRAGGWWAIWRALHSTEAG